MSAEVHLILEVEDGATAARLLRRLHEAVKTSPVFEVASFSEAITVDGTIACPFCGGSEVEEFGLTHVECGCVGDNDSEREGADGTV